jgi:acetate kinase
MKVLFINCGSSSLKYQLIDMETENVIAKGGCEKIGMQDSFHKYKPTDGEPVTFKEFLATHLEAVESVLKVLEDKKIGVIKKITLR